MAAFLAATITSLVLAAEYQNGVLGIVFAELVGQADAARRRERAVRELATLNDSHAELLAYIGQNTGSDPLTEQMTVDVEAIIAQADEAVRQANEVGRSLVLPERPGLE